MRELSFLTQGTVLLDMTKLWRRADHSWGETGLHPHSQMLPLSWVFLIPHHPLGLSCLCQNLLQCIDGPEETNQEGERDRAKNSDT